MPNAEFFQRLGLFAIRDFLDSAACRRINDAMSAGASTEGTVGKSAEFTVDREYRRTRVVDVPDAFTADLTARLESVRQDLAAHYGMPLTGCQPPQFLAYGPGDFYKPHRDAVARAPGQAEFSSARRLTVVVFVNAQSASEQPGTFGGGELTLYEMFDDPSGREVGLPLEPEPGLLISFPSTLLHSVAPIRHGERRTIVSWFV